LVITFSEKELKSIFYKNTYGYLSDTPENQIPDFPFWMSGFNFEA